MSYVIVHDITKRYDHDGVKCDALHGVSFSVSAGEFVAVRGPSGCGKSTLLHIIGAMDQPTMGEVTVDGERLDTMNAEQLSRIRRQRIGFVFQSFNLLPTLAAWENVQLPLALDGMAESESRRRALAVLGEVGLSDRARHFPSQLSGGEMQRVAIARAVAIRPALLLADEPTGSLDSVAGKRVLELLKKLNQEHPLTIMMATHSEDAAAFTGRTLRLYDGRLEDAGDAHAAATPV